MSKEVKLRTFEKRDRETYRGWVNDPKIGALIGRSKPITRSEHREWYHKLVRDKNAVVFAIEVNSQYIGNVWLWDIDWLNRKAEVRILIGERHGLGFGTEALDLITKYAFEKLNLKRVYAYVFTHNKRAKCAFEQARFVVEGTMNSERFIDGGYVDTLIMARIKDGI
jgi:RimJ/RimL family protein N-acetyltransferase